VGNDFELGICHDSAEKHEAARELWQEGTNEWFLDSMEYIDWEARKNHLWVHGIRKCPISNTILRSLLSRLN
jgi:phosphatidylserine/phosphatidylglycerophosphate/cardiolipin synthase-like enzyme